MKYFIFILILLVLAPSCKKEKNRICEIYKNEHGYAIGTVQNMTTNPTSATYHYSYILNGNSYNEKLKAYGIEQGNSSAIGRSYLVVYELSNPSNSNLNTDYEIESEYDFYVLSNELENAPPKPAWPDCK